MSRLSIAVVIAVAALSAGCTMGPDYKRPVVNPPAAFRGASTTDAASLADLKWFEVFRDETLTELVNTALRDSFEIRIAAERVLPCLLCG